MRKWIQHLNPLQLLIYGYLLLLIIGFLLLCLPIFHAGPVDTIDNLFIAASALSTTGLATHSIVEQYNFSGQIFILVLTQIGGLGYMSIGSFILLMQNKSLSSLSSEMVKYDFSLTENYNIFIFIRNLILFTIIIEIIGAIFLGIIFYQEGHDQYIWLGIFHSISAFCTAGFSLFPDSFEQFYDNFYLNAILGILSLAGALGFIVLTDFYQMIIGQKDKISFTSKVILHFTFFVLLWSTIILFLSDSNISKYGPEERLYLAFFQSMASFTTVGFNTYPIANIEAGPLFFMLILMFIGASPSGTGGGMKSTTITALYAQLKSTFKKDTEVIYMNRKIPEDKLKMATSKFFFYIIVICICTFLLLLLEDLNIFDLLFEAVSALGTVGLSTGITQDLSNLGKVIIIVLMFLGRVGPLSFGLVLFSPEEDEQIIEEDIAL